MSNLKIAPAMATAACAAMVALANGGTLAVYAGEQPGNPETAVTTQTKLVEFTFPDPAFGAPVPGGTGSTATLINPDPKAALTDGEASWFRISDDGGNALWDGDVTDTAGNGDLKISSINVVEDIDVSVVSLTFTMRKTKAV